ncbi:hypothetical protein BESB_079920 [Besnoitia besnoiti]|uniref:RNA pseudouridine synthase superfamily protein n=1 Tax=Besnoitia besnoiti TaxID=94643 RepID=A0A2A9MCV4_BESBE|nr:hypothetical protein BESB_079920 [Besnoitia besnoiti]PFH33776.1 hypothetical protein BESB_079920 [Besnoitia besnoiti]
MLVGAFLCPDFPRSRRSLLNRYEAFGIALLRNEERRCQTKRHLPPYSSAHGDSGHGQRLLGGGLKRHSRRSGLRPLATHSRAETSSSSSLRASSSSPDLSSSASGTSFQPRAVSSLGFLEAPRFGSRTGAAGGTLRFVHNSLAERWCVVAKPAGWSLEPQSVRPSVRTVLQPLLDAAIVSRACGLQTGLCSSEAEAGHGAGAGAAELLMSKEMRGAVEGEVEEQEESKAIFFPLQLDADAQGLVFVATDEAMNRQLKSMLQDGSIRREFRVLADLSSVAPPSSPQSSPLSSRATLSLSSVGLPSPRLAAPASSALSLDSLPDFADPSSSWSAAVSAPQSSRASACAAAVGDLPSSWSSPYAEACGGGRKLRGTRRGRAPSGDLSPIRPTSWTAALPLFAVPLRWRASPVERLLAARAVREGAERVQREDAGADVAAEGRRRASTPLRTPLFPASTEVRGCLRLWDPRTGELFTQGSLKSHISARHAKLRLRPVPEKIRLETSQERLLHAVQKAGSRRRDEKLLQRGEASAPFSLVASPALAGKDSRFVSLKRRELLQLLDGSFVLHSLSSVISQNALSHSSGLSASASSLLSEHGKQLFPGDAAGAASRVSRSPELLLLPSLRPSYLAPGAPASFLALPRLSSSWAARTTFTLLSLHRARLLDGSVRLVGLYRVSTQEPPRSHQIRVHFSEAGCPLANDTLYHPSFSGDFKRKVLISSCLTKPDEESAKPQSGSETERSLCFPEDPFGLDHCDEVDSREAFGASPASPASPYSPEAASASGVACGEHTRLGREGEAKAPGTYRAVDGATSPSVAGTPSGDGSEAPPASAARDAGSGGFSVRTNLPGEDGPEGDAGRETAGRGRKKARLQEKTPPSDSLPPLQSADGLLAFDPQEPAVPCFSLSFAASQTLLKAPSHTAGPADRDGVEPPLGDGAPSSANPRQGAAAASSPFFAHSEVLPNHGERGGRACAQVSSPHTASSVGVAAPHETRCHAALPRSSSGGAPAPVISSRALAGDEAGRSCFAAAETRPPPQLCRLAEPGLCASLGLQLFRLTMRDPLKPREKATEELVFELDVPPEWGGIRDSSQKEDLELWEKEGQAFTAQAADARSESGVSAFPTHTAKARHA